MFLLQLIFIRAAVDFAAAATVNFTAAATAPTAAAASVCFGVQKPTYL